MVIVLICFVITLSVLSQNIIILFKFVYYENTTMEKQVFIEENEFRSEYSIVFWTK